jgi:hypothetical protein
MLPRSLVSARGVLARVATAPATRGALAAVAAGGHALQASLHTSSPSLALANKDGASE